MTAPELRPYQREVIEQFHGAVAAGKRRIILVAPTGAGKTVIGADIIRTITRAQQAGARAGASARDHHADQPTSFTRDGIYRTASFMAGVHAAPAGTGASRHRSKPCGCAASTPGRWTCRPPTCW